MERRRTTLGLAIGTLAILVAIALLIGARVKPLAQGARATAEVELPATGKSRR